MWHVVLTQWSVGLLVGVVVAVLSGSYPIGLSFAYGAVTVAFPCTVMAWGMQFSAVSRKASGHLAPMLAAFALWECIKILLAISMLWAAPSVVDELNWLALLAGLVVVLKVYWFGFWMQSRRTG